MGFFSGAFSNLTSSLGTVGTALGVGSSIASLFGKSESQRNKENAALQLQNMKDYFDYTAAYNTPAKQMERYKEAGLNPNLIYGSGGTSLTGASQATASGEYSTDAQRLNNAINGTSQWLRYGLEMRQQNNNDKIAASQVQYNDAAAQAQIARATRDLANVDYEKSPLRLAAIETSNRLAETQMDLNNASYENQLAQASKAQAESDYMVAKKEWESRLTDAQIRCMDVQNFCDKMNAASQQIVALAAQKNADSNAQKVASDIKLQDIMGKKQMQEIQNLLAENKQIEAEALLREATAKIENSKPELYRTIMNYANDITGLIGRAFGSGESIAAGYRDIQVGSAARENAGTRSAAVKNDVTETVTYHGDGKHVNKTTHTFSRKRPSKK